MGRKNDGILIILSNLCRRLHHWVRDNLFYYEATIMTEAWYYFTQQLAALDPVAEPENPAPAEVWKEAENVYWCRIGNCWANIVTGEFR
jgi:hypothetical protein